MWHVRDFFTFSKTRKRHVKNTFKKRFWAKVDKNGPVPSHVPALGRCWLWTGETTSNGYGRINVGGQHDGAVYAHRASWIVEYGAIPSGDGYHGTCVLHRCDVRACVNPAHLFTGDHTANMRDRSAKGRANPPMLRGESHGMAKLTDRDVCTIRCAYETGLYSREDLATEFNVTTMTISYIVRGKTWRHLLPNEKAA
jgi:hypothetical protein